MAHLKQKGYVCPGSLYSDPFSRNVKYSMGVRLNLCVQLVRGGAGVEGDVFLFVPFEIIT